MARLRKGALKGSGKKGYYNWYAQDPKVHDDSRKGIKQPQAVPPMATHPVKAPEPAPVHSDEAQEIIDSFDEETLKKFLEETGYTEDDIRSLNGGLHNDVAVEIGNETWRIFESEDDAEKMAEDQVREDLENEPELFQQDWLQHHISMSDTDRRIIAGEEADAEVEDMDDDDALDNADMKDEYDELGEEQIEWEGKQEEANEKGGTADYSDKIAEIEEKREKLIDDARDAVRDTRYDDIYDALDDPLKYFVEDRGAYTREDLLKQSFISIDIDAATEDAIATDGWQHFLARYDGNSIDLPNGRVMIREN